MPRLNERRCRNGDVTHNLAWLWGRQDSESRALKLASTEHYRQGEKSFLFLSESETQWCMVAGVAVGRVIVFGAQTPVTPELWLKGEKNTFILHSIFMY